MIWKYIVTWVVFNITFEPCSLNKGIDTYGRIGQATTTCLVNHVSYKADTLKREFETKEAVNVFIEGMKPNASNGFLLNPNNIQLIKIDSVKISPIK